MRKKYFFFDIDGTLTDRASGKIVPSAQKALEQLQAAGHFVAIASGRAHYKARGFMEEVGLHHMVCCGGGALVVNDTLLWNKPLDHEKAIALLQQIQALGFGSLVLIDDSIHCWARDDLFRKQVGERKEASIYCIDEHFDPKKHEIYKIYVSISKEQEHLLTLKDTLGHLRFVDEYLMFQYDEKHQGILDMLEQVDGTMQDVIVFGDDYNDIVMFDERWCNVAMGNACEELKKQASFVCDTNTNDGIYKLCEEQGWFEVVDE